MEKRTDMITLFVWGGIFILLLGIIFNSILPFLLGIGLFLAGNCMDMYVAENEDEGDSDSDSDSDIENKNTDNENL